MHAFLGMGSDDKVHTLLCGKQNLFVNFKRTNLLFKIPGSVGKGKWFIFTTLQKLYPTNSAPECSNGCISIVLWDPIFCRSSQVGTNNMPMSRASSMFKSGKYTKKCWQCHSRGLILLWISRIHLKRWVLLTGILKFWASQFCSTTRRMGPT